MAERELRCEEVIERLFEFLDRELTQEHGAAIERHLHRCRDCFTRAEFERRLRAKVTRTGEEKAPESLQRRIGKLMERF